jgi:hypothetical protein
VLATLAFREPSTGGHKLSYWVELHGTTEGRFHPEQERQRAAQAIREIGTNALPHLLAWMEYEPAWWRYKIGPLNDKLSNRIKNTHMVKRMLYTDTAMERSQNAREAFSALGSIAVPALPELERRASLTNSCATRDSAQLAIAYLGPPGVPIISRLLSTPNAGGDGMLIECALALGTNALPLIPIFVQRLQASNAGTAFFSARTLGEMQLDPQTTIPALSNCLFDPRREVRMEAPLAIMRFDQRARPVLPAFTNLLNDPEPDVRKNASTAIVRILEDATFKPPL